MISEAFLTTVQVNFKCQLGRPRCPHMQTNIILNGPLRMFWDEMSDFNILFYTGVQLINNVVSVSGVQQSDSVVHVMYNYSFSDYFLILG